MIAPTTLIAPYRWIPRRSPVWSWRSLLVTERSALATLLTMAHANAPSEKLSSVVLPTATPRTIGINASHTRREYRRLKKRVSRTTLTAGSPALTTCMNETLPRLYDAHAPTCATRWKKRRSARVGANVAASHLETLAGGAIAGTRAPRDAITVAPTASCTQLRIRGRGTPITCAC